MWTWSDPAPSRWRYGWAAYLSTTCPRTCASSAVVHARRSARRRLTRTTTTLRISCIAVHAPLMAVWAHHNGDVFHGAMSSSPMTHPRGAARRTSRRSRRGLVHLPEASYEIGGRCYLFLRDGTRLPANWSTRHGDGSTWATRYDDALRTSTRNMRPERDRARTSSSRGTHGNVRRPTMRYGSGQSARGTDGWDRCEPSAYTDFRRRLSAGLLADAGDAVAVRRGSGEPRSILFQHCTTTADSQCDVLSTRPWNGSSWDVEHHRRGRRTTTGV